MQPVMAQVDTGLIGDMVNLIIVEGLETAWGLVGPAMRR
jgi:hypothetical protein